MNLQMFFLLLLSAMLHGMPAYAQQKTKARPSLITRELYVSDDSLRQGSYPDSYPPDVPTGLNNCCPCIIKYFSKNDVLLNEGVYCMSCKTGFYKTYFPNGKVKVLGHFLENTTGKWDDVTRQKYCDVRDGEWIYFNAAGDTVYKEHWSAGNFIRQLPEQHTSECWKVELSLDGQPVDASGIPRDRIRDIKITPLFKNSFGDSSAVVIHFIVSRPEGRSYASHYYRLTEYHSINIDRLVMLNGSDGGPLDFVMEIFSNRKRIQRIPINVKP